MKKIALGLVLSLLIFGSVFSTPTYAEDHPEIEVTSIEVIN